MEVRPKGKFEFIKPHIILDRLRQLSTPRQFLYLFYGIALLMVIEIMLGLASYVILKNSIMLKGANLDNKLKTFSGIDLDLSELQLIYNEKYSQVDSRSPEKLLKKIDKEVNFLRGNLKNRLKPINASLAKLKSLDSAQIDYKNYQVVRSEIKAIRETLKTPEQTLRRLRQSNSWIKYGYFIPTAVLLLFLAGLVAFYLIIARQIARDHLRALKHFEEITHKYGRGVIVSEIKDFPCSEYRDVKDALNIHFQTLRETYEKIYLQVSETFPMIKDLANLTEQNEEQFISIKHDFQNLIENTYHKLDSFPGVAERIRKLNANLTESQLEAARLEKSFNEAGVYFEEGPLKIDGIETQIDEREKFSKDVTAELKKLCIILDGFLQTSSIFQGIAEQTAVLSLNASIEAARVGTAGDGFDIAATEISDLAEKISRAPHELLLVITMLRKKTESVIKVYEASITQSVNGRRFLKEIKEKLNLFWTEYHKYLLEIRGYEKLVHEFEEKQKSLEKLTSFLALLNMNTPANYARVSATLEVINKTEKLSTSLHHLAGMLAEVTQIVEKLRDK